mgnify:CR=1 FL=1
MIKNNSIKINHVIFPFIALTLSIFLFLWDKILSCFLLICGLFISIFLTNTYKKYNKIYQFKIIYNTLFFSLLIGLICFFYVYESADGKRDYLYDLYLIFSSSSITIFISSIFWGTLISFKINKEENTTTFPNTKEKIKPLAILYFILSIFNSVMLTIFN